MDAPISLPPVQADVRTVNADKVFAALADPTRRRLLMSLSDGQWHSGRLAGGRLPKHHDLTRKHMAVLVSAGLVVGEPDPVDQRRQRFKLAPSVRTDVAPQGRSLDFGCCVLRCDVS
jgi:DNA-binding transcriptional ArsR family regulator